MPLIIPPGFAQAVYVFNWTGDSEPMVCTMGHDVGAFGGDGEQAAEDIAAHLFASDVVVSLSDVVSFIGVDLYVGQDGGPSLVFDYTLPAPQSGTADATSLPQNSAYLFRKRTGLGGRRGRGRMYFPGVGESVVNNVGVVDSTHQALIQSRLDDWHGFMVNGNGSALEAPPVVLHRSEGAGTEPAPTPITALTIDGLIATQRQRLRR